ncbi:tetratricopeptide repeat protein [Clostridium sp. OS1-26]|uniref:tetratricopeptide repeat protein n=1 Tax=Clostridium sp. OS1-26 TaxID=3070681 RepID=UPI0027E03C33|nr:tetratricopeptide repeat protein [Clostridium sp. OS1-26]WML36224.1 tetratricopeptide repeat protein [Clostridium sp. OS1-26]
MDKSKRVYIKALEKYNNGYIDKAIELSEESISLNIKNAAAINLKGLLYYLKGDLDTCQRLWKMNYQLNKDGVSERYLSDSKRDNERQKLYYESLSLIKELKINDALEILEQCLQSDYNYINVNNYMATCCINKGYYDKALSHIEKVLKIDKNNDMAKENKNELKKLGIVNSKVDTKKIACTLGGIVCILAFTLVVINFTKRDTISRLFMNINNIKSNFKNNNTKKETSKGAIKESDVVKSNAAKNNIASVKSEAQVFPEDNIKKDIENKNFENIYTEYMKWKDKNLSINDKLTISKANELLLQEGVNYFYNKGSQYINAKNYLEAKEYLLKAYTLGGQSYLYSHIIYMIGSSYELSGDAENAIKYYTQYDENFSNGDYEETILYNLVIIYKDVDKDKAKSYSQKLIDKYPNSIYNNSITKGLVSN